MPKQGTPPPREALGGSDPDPGVCVGGMSPLLTASPPFFCPRRKWVRQVLRPRKGNRGKPVFGKVWETEPPEWLELTPVEEEEEEEAEEGQQEEEEENEMPEEEEEGIEEEEEELEEEEEELEEEAEEGQQEEEEEEEKETPKEEQLEEEGIKPAVEAAAQDPSQDWKKSIRRVRLEITIVMTKTEVCRLPEVLIHGPPPPAAPDHATPPPENPPRPTCDLPAADDN